MRLKNINFENFSKFKKVKKNEKQSIKFFFFLISIKETQKQRFGDGGLNEFITAWEVDA